MPDSVAVKLFWLAMTVGFRIGPHLLDQSADQLL